MVLPDTSVWIDFLRKREHRRRHDLAPPIESRQVVVCGPIAAELMLGASEQAGDRLWASLLALPWQPFRTEDWRTVGELSAALRAQGTPIALTDLEIAVAAVNARATLWTGDSDFDRVVEVLPRLEIRRFRR